MLVVVGLIIAFIIVAIYARRYRGMRLCRWREDRTGSLGNLHKFRCAFCGAETFSTTGKPPGACLRKAPDQ